MEKTKRFLLRCSPELHRKFRIWCAENDVSAQAALEWATMLYVAGQLAPPPREDT